MRSTSSSLSTPYPTSIRSQAWTWPVIWEYSKRALEKDSGTAPEHEEMRWTYLILVVQYVLFIFPTVTATSKVCTKFKVSNCNECIQSGPFCAWCKQPNFTSAGEPDSVRCDTDEVLGKRGCKEVDIVYHDSRSVVKDRTRLSDRVQLTPREISLQLRPGKAAEFDVTFRRAQGYPVDLYYLMDLSYSMNDDLQNVKNLGSNLLEALNKITTSAQIGFGSFVDKTVLPFVNTHPEKLKNPCPERNENCQPPFAFKHILKLTEDGKQFQDQVGKQGISGNLDAPEGGLDAMMQVAVCGDKIGWRNVTRLLVYATDDGFHIAGDGKLASILIPNDGQCHLEDNLYKRSNEFDYPSVGQLAQKLSENNIQAVFAVTSNMVQTYRNLSKLIPKSVVGELSSDSRNVVQLITDAYQALSSEVILDHGTTPDFLEILYDSLCPGDIKENQLKGMCSNVKIGEEIKFKVKVTASKCLQDQSFAIRPLGFTDTLTVSVRTLCDCECDETPRPGDCNSNGTIKCGICSCNEGFVGKNCECVTGGKTSQELEQSCKKENGSAVCSGAGDCICGQCTCHTNEDTSKKIYGQYCQCDNWNCELFEGRLCAGQGTCDCGVCRCNEGYEGSACQCKRSTSNCKNAKGSVCSGRGKCECNNCICKPGYLQPHCESCPGCPSPCSKFGPCVECYINQEDGSTQNCSHLCPGVKAERVEELKRETVCKEKDSSNCWMQYVIVEDDGEDKFTITYTLKRECPEAPNFVAIVGGTTAGVILIGMACLIIWKIITEIKDRNEYNRFEKERQNCKWNQASNPLYHKATTTVQNPNFSGE
ncbi:integrin beta-2 isoform X3 [Xenopus tropicalis]|uniref:Integrin beta n=1 Tax=Xenopus tropicalis TaxID=8364 RepID=A0A8J1ITT0_XENTR|nr:integrin beta-2 isoform X3 [Xenopus tropicalis]XP_031749005.1 integrin beta-2 isoform X3 [Xenopus tropicalis]XP_031749008.1 integrin beta-2 isoform X3 [Xenopus tropicalis]